MIHKFGLSKWSKVVSVNSGMVFAGSAFAALDTTSTGAIGTALTGAVTDSVAAGALVIACVAGVVVIGMVIQMVRKA